MTDNRTDKRMETAERMTAETTYKAWATSPEGRRVYMGRFRGVTKLAVAIAQSCIAREHGSQLEIHIVSDPDEKPFAGKIL